MNNGEWNAVLQFLESENNRGNECICRCSQCTGTYTHRRAYINEDGDYVLSSDTLNNLLEDYKWTDNFQHNGQDESKWGHWFVRYWQAAKKDGSLTEENRVKQSLVKREYDEEEHD